MRRVEPIRRAGRRGDGPRGAPAERGATPPPAPARRGPGTLWHIARRIGSGWFVGKLAAVAVLAAGWWAVTEAAAAPELRVAHIMVAGNDLVPAEEIAAALAPVDTNVFLIRGPRLGRQLLEDPAIASARVEPRLPNWISVRVRERSPVVVWESSEGPALVDASGRVLRAGARALPVVAAPDGPVPRVGDQVDPRVVRVAAALGPRASELDLDGGRVEFRPGTGVTLVSPVRPERVVLGFGSDLETQLIAYETIRRHIDQTRARAEVIDVRFADRPFWR